MIIQILINTNIAASGDGFGSYYSGERFLDSDLKMHKEVYNITGVQDVTYFDYGVKVRFNDGKEIFLSYHNLIGIKENSK